MADNQRDHRDDDMDGEIHLPADLPILPISEAAGAVFGWLLIQRRGS